MTAERLPRIDGLELDSYRGDVPGLMARISHLVSDPA